MEENKNKSFMKSSYGDEKLDKSNELNETMTIKNTSQDEYTSKIHSLGGGNNG